MAKSQPQVRRENVTQDTHNSSGSQFVQETLLPDREQNFSGLPNRLNRFAPQVFNVRSVALTKVQTLEATELNHAFPFPIKIGQQCCFGPARVFLRVIQRID